MAELLYLLSGDSALSTVLPFRAHDIVTKAIQELRKQGYMEEFTRESLTKYATECEKLLMISSTNDTIEPVTNFIEYIITTGSQHQESAQTKFQKILQADWTHRWSTIQNMMKITFNHISTHQEIICQLHHALDYCT